MSQPGGYSPSLPSGPPPAAPTRHRALTYVVVMVGGLLVGLAAGFGGYSLTSGRTPAAEDRYVQGTCQALADFREGDRSWAEADSWQDAFVAYHLWTAVIGYADAAAESDPAFDLGDRSPDQVDLSRLDVEALVQSESALADLCAERGL